MRHTYLLSSGMVMLLLVGCSEGDRLPVETSMKSPTVPTASSVTLTSSVPDVTGTWHWAAVGQFTVPSSVVERLFGIEPEGPMTHLRCETSGTMLLVQSGTTFSGLATRTGGSCQTEAGLVFVPPPSAWPNSLPVADGRITGRGIHFLFGVVAGMGCPHTGAITNVEGGTATELKANGRCIIPGHPQSPAPLDPPPLGTSHDTSFVVTRP